MKKQLKLKNLSSNELNKQKMSLAKGGEAPAACMKRCKGLTKNPSEATAAAVCGLFYKKDD